MQRNKKVTAVPETLRSKNEIKHTAHLRANLILTSNDEFVKSTMERKNNNEKLKRTLSASE